MSQPDASLSNAARRVLNDVAEQFERRDEAVRGLCAITESRQIKHGAFGPAGSVEQGEHRLDDPEATAEEEDLIPFLRGDAYDRSELSSYESNQLRVRAKLREPTGAEGEVPGADFTFQKDPARLLSVEVRTPELSGLAGFLMAATESKMTFEYVNGVPLTSEMQMRMRSRGVGRFRFDHEVILSVRYEPCT